MEDRAHGNPNKLPPIILFLNAGIEHGPVASVVVVLWDRFGYGELIDLGGDGLRDAGWNRDIAFFTRDDKVTKVSPVCAIETVF